MLGSCDKHLSFSRAAKNFTICQGGQEEEGELLPIRRLGRRLRRRRIGEGTQRGRQIAGKREREREIEGGEEKVGNPLKYVLKPLCRAQPGNRRIHRPAPERRLCNQSLPSSSRQLPAPTGGQLGGKGGREGGQRE